MKRLSTQQGFSLIGLLIGLLISVLCILGSLTLYKSLIRVATESKLDAMHDGQLAAASLVIQMEVQSAGYGINNAGVNDVVVRTPTAGETQVLWRYANPTNGAFECRGLHEYGVTEDNGDKYRVLRVVKAASGCNGTAVLGTLDWGTQVSVLGRWRVHNDGIANIGLDDHITTKATLFEFTVGPTTCNPTYGAVASSTATHLRLQVKAPSSAKLQGANLTENIYHYCLANTYPT